MKFLYFIFNLHQIIKIYSGKIVAIEGILRMIYLTSDSFVIEMGILLSTLCWAGDRKTGQTGQLQSNIFYHGTFCMF